MGGFFGTISTKDCVNDLFYGTDYNSHLGTKRAGLVTFDHEKGFSRSIHSLERDYFRSKFEDELHEFSGNQGLGVISDTDPQPIIINSHLGRYAVVTVAKINNLREIADELLAQRMHLSEQSANNLNQTELVALLINMGSTFVEGINMVYRKIKGSCSMLILTEDGIIAARDFLGRTPIVIGRKEVHKLSPIGTDDWEKAYAVSSETTSFPNLDYKPVRDLGPGEIVRLRADGIQVLQKPFTRCQICSFLWVYYGFPLGYSEGSGIPYKRAVLKYTPTWPRSFTPGNQTRRDLVAKMKLIPNEALLRGQRVVFCDDSIVRGTQLRDNAREFVQNGAKEVHVRISCPPLVYGCPFIGFTNSKSDLELITRRIIRDFEGDDKIKLDQYAKTDSPEYKRMVDEIARRLGLTSLKFARIEDLIESIGLPKEKVCTHCFDGSSYDQQGDGDFFG